MKGMRNARKGNWNKISKEIDLNIFVLATWSSGRNQSTSGSKH
jgi:hypothetical protein